MALNTNYTRLTYQELIEDFQNRLRNDPRFKKLSSAAIYNMFMEMLAGTIDMTNFFMQRTAEECFIDTAKLESSIIKHGKTLGYNPKRLVPAQAEISITIKGPLPEGLKAGATVYFAQKETNLSFNNKKYVLSTDYSYTFDESDIEDSKSSTWSKTIYLSKKASSMKYVIISGSKEYATSATEPITIYQGEFRTINFAGSDNVRKLGKNYQYYDINDTSFSNWYGKRDIHTFKYNTYNKESGYTKVGIGKTEDEAFKSENLFDIEDYSIYANEKVIKAESLKEPLNVCQIVTNQDKTVRLQFGDGEIVRCGLKTADDTIYIQYFSTEGADANAVGTSGSMLNTSTRFFASQQGAVIDVTSNVQFTLESNIFGGANFEDSQSIKNNAPRYYASGNRLVTKPDYISWFNSLTNPLNVKNSVVMGQEGIETETSYLPFLQNFILYSITTSPYIINGKENTFKNPFVDDPSVKEPFSLYGDSSDYINHLVDYSKITTDLNSVYSEQYDSNPTEQCFKDIKTIRELIEDKMGIDSKILSMPPIVHLYDVYGTVEVDSLANLQKYKLEVENDVYKWLNDHTSFNSPIYKSEIVKIFNQKENTRYADLDIKVSQLIYDNMASATISKNNPKNADLIGDGFSCTIETQSGYLIYKIEIPKGTYFLGESSDSALTIDSVNVLKNKIFSFVATDEDRNLNSTPFDITESKDSVYLFFRKYNATDTNSFNYSTMSFMPETLQAQAEYDPEYMATIQSKFDDIASTNDISEISTHGDSDNSKARIEIKKKKVTGDVGMTEKRFWQELASTLPPDVAVNAYKFYKPAIEDSVLDDNNNIVNYSLESEMPIIRLNITYKYRA